MKQEAIKAYIKHILEVYDQEYKNADEYDKQRLDLIKKLVNELKLKDVITEKDLVEIQNINNGISFYLTTNKIINFLNK